MATEKTHQQATQLAAQLMAAFSSLPTSDQTAQTEELKKRLIPFLEKGVSEDNIKAAFAGGSSVPEASEDTRLTAFLDRINARSLTNRNDDSLQELTALRLAQQVMHDVLPELSPANEMVELSKPNGLKDKMLGFLQGDNVDQQTIIGTFTRARDKLRSLPGAPDIYHPDHAPEAFQAMTSIAEDDLRQATRSKVAQLGKSEHQIHKQQEEEEEKAQYRVQAWEEIHAKATADYAHAFGRHADGREMNIEEKYITMREMAEKRAKEIEAREKVLAKFETSKQSPGNSQARLSEQQARAALAASGPAVFVKKQWQEVTRTAWSYTTGLPPGSRLGNGYNNGAGNGFSWFRTFPVLKTVSKVVNRENFRAARALSDATNDRRLAQDAPKRIEKGGSKSIEQTVDEILAKVIRGNAATSSVVAASLDAAIFLEAADTDGTTGLRSAEKNRTANRMKAEALAHSRNPVADGAMWEYRFGKDLRQVNPGLGGDKERVFAEMAGEKAADIANTVMDNHDDDENQRRAGLTSLAKKYAADMNTLTLSSSTRPEDREKVAAAVAEKLLVWNQKTALLSGDKAFQVPMDYLRATQVEGMASLLNATPSNYAGHDKREVIGLPRDMAAMPVAVARAPVPTRSQKAANSNFILAALQKFKAQIGMDRQDGSIDGNWVDQKEGMRPVLNESLSGDALKALEKAGGKEAYAALQYAVKQNGAVELNSDARHALDTATMQAINATAQDVVNNSPPTLVGSPGRIPTTLPRRS